MLFGTERRRSVALLPALVLFGACRPSATPLSGDSGFDAGGVPGTDYRGTGGFFLASGTDGGTGGSSPWMPLTVAVLGDGTVTLPEAECSMPIDAGQLGPIDGCLVTVGCAFQFSSLGGTGTLDGGVLELSASGQLAGCGISVGLPAVLAFTGSNG
jgi:hypothetical protein